MNRINQSSIDNPSHHKPVFSVVMPIYNTARYLKEAIDSVLAQSYPQFELICVNDGSTDNSSDIVRSYNDSRIRLIEQKNRGLSGARNTGINHAQGLYVAFLDSDDFWHKDKLLAHMNHFSRDPKLCISFSASSFIDEDSKQLGIGQHPKLTDITPVDIFCRNPIGNGSAPVFKKSTLMQMAELFSDHQGKRLSYFDETMRQSEDVDFWLRVILKTNAKFGGVAKALTYYRVNAGGLSANLDKQYAAWHKAVQKNRSLNPEFFEKNLALASAYQFRYLARRAIQSGNRLGALSLVNKALITCPKILIQEPKRTLVTYGCSILAFLPQALYKRIEAFAMQISALRYKHSLKA